MNISDMKFISHRPLNFNHGWYHIFHIMLSKSFISSNIQPYTSEYNKYSIVCGKGVNRSTELNQWFTPNHIRCQ